MDSGDSKNIYLELLERISSQTNDTQKAIAELDKKVDLHIQKTEFELSNIHKLDGQQNDLLDKHIAGVNTLKEMFENQKLSCHARFEQIEAPRRLMKVVKDSLLWIAALVGAVLGILKVFLK